MQDGAQLGNGDVDSDGTQLLPGRQQRATVKVAATTTGNRQPRQATTTTANGPQQPARALGELTAALPETTVSYMLATMSWYMCTAPPPMTLPVSPTDLATLSRMYPPRTWSEPRVWMDAAPPERPASLRSRLVSKTWPSLLRK